MLEHIERDGGTIAVDVSGTGPLVVLAHGMGDSRHSYRFLVPELVAAGYRVANVDIRGCGDSSTGWTGYSRADIAGDLVAVVRHLGGPAVVVGQSISGGAATIAAADAPELITGVVELAPLHPGAVVRPRRVPPQPEPPPIRHRPTPPGHDGRQPAGLARVPGPGRRRQARRLGHRTRAHRGHPAAARADGRAHGDDEDQPGRRRRSTG
ncbi:alpha/beta fold hydrolase [Curtobacterium sp. MCPF17_052]|uniref:alpha/beta fold hydrolase n=1 Tax=Curtobacterium sp. MCPF17_052 TaxID=2175655 RepID=UPI0024DF70BF|nr:alpha/beta fold hydrolase [Curtobacterium sp. MCPF17_052]WIB12139.1 alpha/beta fold hydrolase [Curtobacterium sp. MCPF17_052]